MKRRSLLRLTSLLPVCFIGSRCLQAYDPRPLRAVDVAQQAERLNYLARNVRTAADARALVDFVADVFADVSLPSLLSRGLRERMTQAEFLSATNSEQLIPEQRIADAWNEYAATMRAPADSQVTSAELHNLRDALFTGATMFWARQNRTVWTVPAIYATGADGHLVSGCRALEATLLLWELAKLPDNLRAARNRVRDGVLMSEEFAKPRDEETEKRMMSFSVRPPDPLETAQRTFVRQHGTRAFAREVSRLVLQTLGQGT